MIAASARWILVIALDEGARWDDSNAVRGLFGFVERTEADVALDRCKKLTPKASMQVVSRQWFDEQSEEAS